MRTSKAFSDISEFRLTYELHRGLYYCVASAAVAAVVAAVAVDNDAAAAAAADSAFYSAAADATAVFDRSQRSYLTS